MNNVKDLDECNCCGGSNLIRGVSVEDGKIEVPIIFCRDCFNWW